MIAITVDTEWSPDPVLRDTLALLDEYGVSATLFSTHDDPFDHDQHERALHPNFLGDLSDPSSIDDLLRIFPNANGIRSHRMEISTPLRDEFVKRGIVYESNYMMYRVPEVTPFPMPGGTLQFPVFWMDDIWFTYDARNFDVEQLIEGTGLKVFDFHPPHIYYNTPSPEYYEKHKDEYWSEPACASGLRSSGNGVRDVFVELLTYIEKQRLDTYTLGQLHEDYDEGEP